MRIVAYACIDPDPPVQRGLLPLSELTILLGPNDSGKSTWLRAVERDLRGGHVPVSDERSELRKVGVFYVQLTPREMARVFDEALGNRAQWGAAKRFGGIRPPWDDGLWRVDPKAAVDLAFPGSEAEVEQALRASLAEQDRERAVILDALANSNIVAFEPAGTSRDRPLFNIYWCLEPIGDLNAALAQALRESKLRHFDNQRLKAAGKFVPARGAYAMNFPYPDHLLLEEAPVPVVSVGQASRFPMPSSLAVPTEVTSIESALIEAVSALADAARFAPVDVRDDGPPTQQERQDRQAPQGWLEQQGDAMRVAPDVVAACAFIESAANRLLPSFIGDRYRLVVGTEPIDRWFGESPLHLAVRPHDADERDEFGVDAVADGLRLWTQLALLEAAEQTGRVRSYLFELAGDWRGAEESAADAAQRDEDDADAEFGEAERLKDEFDTAVAGLRNVTEFGRVTGELAQRLTAKPAQDIMSRQARDRRLFVVDEPERHLHPRRQREAAEWLAQTASQRAAPALLASHSTAFLSLPTTEGLSYVYCSRTGTNSAVRRVTAAEIADLDDIGAEMGFDRGELLATVAVFLLVEGRHDEDVITRAFRAELADAHIVVAQIGGASSATAILDSQALWRYTTAKVALSTDKFTSEVFKQLMGDDDELKKLRKHDAPEETKALATLMTNAKMQGKKVCLLGHAGDDLIDVIDEDVVQELHPKYPGHVEARRQWDEARQQDPKLKAGRKKQWYAEHFGIQNDVLTYQEIGDTLAEKGRKPPALAQIVQGAVMLAQSP